MTANMTDEEAEEAIRQFAEITDTDEAFAHFMLQDDNFDLERTLARYYSAQDPEVLYQKFRIEDAKEGEEAKKKIEGEGSSRDGEISREQSKQPPKKRARQMAELPAELTMVSWNVDGNDERAKENRFLAILYLIAKTNPEVIFLQEMVTELIPRLSELMAPMYNIIISDPDAPYFCVTLVSKNINITQTEIIPFPNTQMGRSMTVVQGQWQRLRLALINTHLESMRDTTEVRKAQFGRCIEKMKVLSTSSSAPDDTLLIFGGDLNIRDKEVEAVKSVWGFPESVRDAWEAAGSSANSRFTWDMCRNDNYPANGNARCRFDRIYFSGPYEDVEFKLEGTSRIKGPNLFPSDHFAVICRFMSPKNTATATNAANSSTSTAFGEPATEPTNMEQC